MLVIGCIWKGKYGSYMVAIIRNFTSWEVRLTLITWRGFGVCWSWNHLRVDRLSCGREWVMGCRRGAGVGVRVRRSVGMWGWLRVCDGEVGVVVSVWVWWWGGGYCGCDGEVEVIVCMGWWWGGGYCACVIVRWWLFWVWVWWWSGGCECGYDDEVGFIVSCRCDAEVESGSVWLMV